MIQKGVAQTISFQGVSVGKGIFRFLQVILIPVFFFVSFSTIRIIQISVINQQSYRISPDLWNDIRMTKKPQKNLIRICGLDLFLVKIYGQNDTKESRYL